MLSRRMFMGMASAFALKPKAEEAKLFVCVEVRQADGSWRVEPRGLRAVSKGQWIRLHDAPGVDSPVKLAAQADEDGRDVLDADGRMCGGLYYVEETAVIA